MTREDPREGTTVVVETIAVRLAAAVIAETMEGNGVEEEEVSQRKQL